MTRRLSRSEVLSLATDQKIYRRTDHMFAGLLALQWLVGITLACLHASEHALWVLFLVLDLFLFYFAYQSRRETLATASRQAELEELNASIESKVHERTRELYESEQRFASLMKSFPVGVFRTDAGGECIYVNERYSAIEGITPEEAIGHGWTKALHPDDRQRVCEQWRKTVESGGDFLMEYRLLTPSSRIVWVLTSAASLCDESGAVIGFLGNVMDITERKMLEEQVRQSQKMESIGRLAGGIAHDFNNLITIILGNAELALTDLPADQHLLAEEVGTISEAAQRAAALTKQLLAFSRKQLLEPKPLNINRVVSALEKMLARLIGEDISLVTRLKSDVWQVMADPGQIEQIIMNLVVNSRDAMRQGGTLRIESSNVEFGESYVLGNPGVTPGSYVCLSVRDTGCGIPPELLSLVFEPFFTTKQAGEGTGMGLATVFGIVSQSNGRVTVESEPGKGTTFNVYLPRWEGAAEEEQAPESSLPLAPGTETVLLVEDEDGVRRLAKRILEAEGYRVIEAGGGFEALKLAAEFGDLIDLLITDVVMPVISGRQLADQLSAVLPRLKVLYLSGYTADVICPQGIMEDGVIFLQKPFTRESLIQKLQQLTHSSSDQAVAVCV